MRALLIEDTLNFQRGIDPKDAMQTGDIKKRKLDSLSHMAILITQTIKELAKQYHKRVIIDDSVPENFMAYFIYGNYSYGLRINDDQHFEAFCENQKFPAASEEYFSTIEEAKEQLIKWL